MNLSQRMVTAAAACLVLFIGCESKRETVNKGREAVKDAVTQPFKTLDSANDSIKQSEEKQKAALEQVDREIK